jgi:L-aminopeptidase/D-esterase-like protein
VRAGPRNLITDVEGLLVGQAEDHALKSGLSVVVGDAPMVAGVHVMGGAPGTRETDLLRPDASVQGVDALVLSGGSAFGLDAASGVVARLAGDGRGFLAAGHRVPIVPAAILFDLANGGDKGWSDNPYRELGQIAYRARALEFQLGTHGAGTGASVAGLKGGIGSASAVMASGAVVGALVAVNALGQVTVGDGPEFWAAPFEVGDEFGGRGVSRERAPEPRTKLGGGGNTTIAVVATDLRLTKADATRMAIAAHDGIARAVVPAHTPMDGDLVFACATGKRDAGDADRLFLGHVAATVLARAIARAVFSAKSAPGDLVATWRESFNPL